jgi:hypothetical protein
VQIQRLQSEGASCTDWLDADILDLSQGGASLLIFDTHPFQVGDHLVVDLKAHLNCDRQLLPGLVRWFVRSNGVIAMGVEFDADLPGLPQLLPERRHRLRHSHEEAPP